MEQKIHRRFRFKRTKRFKRDYRKLQPFEQAKAAAVFEKFKKNPWDAALKTHKISSLSQRAGTPVWAIYVDSDLRVLFMQKGNDIIALTIGNHDVYKRQSF